ncbi:OmpA family protein [Halioglobus maricola]|uniref:OmpA family protein n=1 Tax=Halioglobus maricola TaxID=2601894 RepID=A0A5P9NGR6_9GAMM|nr:OmpA family protein [Halioglobus maricola]QFU74736.1 OmpA family protein [Halioglobus maricola]
MWGFLLIPAAMIVGAFLTQPEPPPQPTDTIILLPDEDGSVGTLVVSGSTGQTTLNSAYATAQADSAGGLSAGTTSAAAVENEFGAMLAATPAAPRSFVVTFKSGSADTLSAESQAEVDEIKRYLLTLPAPEIQVIGHTDRVGSVEDNDRLSRARADTVKQFISDAGVTAVRIDSSGRGEREPVVATADGRAEARNRRVEIRVR